MKCTKVHEPFLAKVSAIAKFVAAAGGNNIPFCSLATFRRRPKLDATKPTEEDTLAVLQTPLSICCVPRTPARQICKSETVAHSRAPIPRPATPEYFVMST